MQIIPAIDLKDGRCVRLRQGDMNDETIYGEDPVEVAAKWVEAGARRLHLVDLNGAINGEPINADIIYEITRAFPELPVQVGGGIRTEKTIELYLDVGVQYVILGTKAVRNPAFVGEVCAEFPYQIMVGIDAKDGKVAIDGWEKVSDFTAIDLAQRFEDDGVSSIIYTDIARDGMLKGVNVEATVKMAQATEIPIIASGGVKNLDDIRRLCEVREEGITGVIAGRSLYENTLDLAEAQNLADELMPREKE